MDPAKLPDTAEMRLQRQVIDVSVYFEEPATPANYSISAEPEPATAGGYTMTSREKSPGHQDRMPEKKLAIGV